MTQIGPKGNSFCEAGLLRGAGRVHHTAGREGIGTANTPEPPRGVADKGPSTADSLGQRDASEGASGAVIFVRPSHQSSELCQGARAIHRWCHNKQRTKLGEFHQ